MGPKKSLGQHWLNDKASLEAICDAADIKAGDQVLEIGPGQGSLTASLLSRGAKVTAVELDQTLAASLQDRFKEDPFKLNTLSILDFDFSTLPKDYKIVANIPYYLTNHLLRLFTSIPNQPRLAVLLVQQEVAQRVCAKPGEMSVLSVAIQIYYEATLGLKIPAKLFTPPPKVDSQVLILKRRQEPLFELETQEFLKLVKAGFSARRKKLRSSLSGGLGISTSDAEKILSRVGLDPNLRAQNLTLEDWYKLYQANN